jgi:hypothetical protein
MPYATPRHEGGTFVDEGPSGCFYLYTSRWVLLSDKSESASTKCYPERTVNPRGFRPGSLGGQFSTKSKMFHPSYHSNLAGRSEQTWLIRPRRLPRSGLLREPIVSWSALCQRRLGSTPTSTRATHVLASGRRERCGVPVAYREHVLSPSLPRTVRYGGLLR